MVDDSVKVILVGDGGSGKTTYLNRMKTGEFGKKYEATLGCEVCRVAFNTSRGTVVFEVWDTAGQEKYGCLFDGYFIGARYAIVMLDATSKKSLSNAAYWINKVKNIEETCKFSVVCNKSDVKEKKIKEQAVYSLLGNHLQSMLPYCEMSCYTMENVQIPILLIIKDLFNDITIRILVEAAPAAPQMETVNPEQMKNILDQANKVRIDEDMDVDDF